MASNLVDSRRAGCRFVATLFVYFRRGREGRALVHTIQPSSLALSLATRLAPGTLGNRETPVEGGPRPGKRAKMERRFSLTSVVALHPPAGGAKSSHQVRVQPK